MHELLGAYARELAASCQGESEQHEALTRLFDYYLYTATTAMDILFPADHQRRPRIARPATPIPPLTSPVAARAWLDIERASFVAIARFTAGNGWPAHATRLATIMFRYLECGGHYPEALTIHTQARAAARKISDRSGEALALNGLASVHWRQCRYQQASHHLHDALALFRDIGDRTGQARALGNLGLVYFWQGQAASRPPVTTSKP